MKNVLESLLLPPGLIVMIALAGLLALRTRRRLGVWLLGGAVALLYVLSLPVTAAALMSWLQTSPALTAADLARRDAQVIVVLAGGRYSGAPEYGGDTLSALTLERLRYAVHLQRATGLPLVMVGGVQRDEHKSEAELLKEAANADFGVPVLLTENRSRTTWENAVLTAPLLQARGITRIYLVTHAWHMPRALWAFRQQQGLRVTAAPTAFFTAELTRVGSWLPSGRALHYVYFACHEAVGLLWYRLPAGVRD